MENIKEHDILVDKFLEKVKQDYQKHFNKFILNICLMKKYELEQDTEFVSYDIPVNSTVLSWVKTNIIDNNAQMFRRVQYKNNDNNTAIHYVHSDDIKIFMKDDFITRLLTHITVEDNNINSLAWLFSMDHTNISNRLISILERVYIEDLDS